MAHIHIQDKTLKTMFKKIIVLLILAVFIFAAWAFIEYKKVAGEAEAQILVDTQYLKEQLKEQKSKSQGPFREDTFKELELVESQLMLQSVNEAQQFVRQYHSLFIYQGHTRCLLSKLIYPQRQSALLSQRWLAEGVDCLPF